MPDNKKKKKLDAKRFSMLQKHEVNYIKKVCKLAIADFEKEIKIHGPLACIELCHCKKKLRLVALTRICKVLLKCLSS